MESLDHEQSILKTNLNKNYAPPIINNRPITNSNPIIKNQTSSANIVLFNPNILYLDPITIRCPLCQRLVTTNVENSCNYRSLFLFCITGFIPYFCIQCNRYKGYCCRNAVHYCPKCNGKIGIYSSC